ncbi:hypothetical protein BGZ63DRAFT_370085 [Mariannaea sp. PMI_226]|nr:hypothetical protein BGZ63DRAFT_370085 [Mariannaea sp. PMI_226]
MENGFDLAIFFSMTLLLPVASWHAPGGAGVGCSWAHCPWPMVQQTHGGRKKCLSVHGGCPGGPDRTPGDEHSAVFERGGSNSKKKSSVQSQAITTKLLRIMGLDCLQRQLSWLHAKSEHVTVICGFAHQSRQHAIVGGH